MKAYKLRTMLFLFTFCFFFSSCNKFSTLKLNRDPAITLIMAETNPEDSISGRMDLAFKQKLEELSGGRILVDIKFAGVLGDENQVLGLLNKDDPSVQLATVDGILGNYGGTKSKLLGLPYTFQSINHFWKFVNSDLAQIIINEPEETRVNIKGLCYGECGFRNFFGSEKILTPEDLAGKKLRTYGISSAQFADVSGSIPVKVNSSDVYMALQTGRIDVAGDSISNYLANSYYEVAPYMTLDKHTLNVIEIVISKGTWKKLSDHQRELIQSAADYASEYCCIISEQEENNAAIQLMEKGVEFVEIKNLSAWKNAFRAITSYYSWENPDLYKKIRNME